MLQRVKTAFVGRYLTAVVSQVAGASIKLGVGKKMHFTLKGISHACKRLLASLCGNEWQEK